MALYYTVLGGSRIADKTLDGNGDFQDLSGADDANVTDFSDTDFIFCVNVNSSNKNTKAAQYKLQWQDDASPGYVDLDTTGAMKFGTTGLTNGNQVYVIGGANHPQQICTSVKTYLIGYQVEGTKLSTSVDLGANQESEYAFAVGCGDATAEHTYSFQIYDSTNGRIVGQCGATITIASAAETVTLTGVDALSFTGQSVSFNDVMSLGTKALTLTGLSLTSSIDVVFNFIKTALTFIGKDISPKESCNLDAKALSFTGKNMDVGGDILVVLETLALTLTGKLISIAESVALYVKALALTGKDMDPKEAYNMDTLATNFTGKTTFINETFSMAKTAIAFTGQSITSAIGTLVTLIKTSLAFTGQPLSTNETFSLVKTALAFTGQSISSIVSSAISLAKATLAFTGKVVKINETFKLVNGTLLFGAKIISIISGVINDILYPFGTKPFDLDEWDQYKFRP